MVTETFDDMQIQISKFIRSMELFELKNVNVHDPKIEKDLQKLQRISNSAII